MKVILQSQGSECGLVCLAMVSSHFGGQSDIIALRTRFPVSSKGLNLERVVRIAGALDLSARAVRVEIEELTSLKLPCILHWDFNHFVVLESISGGRYVLCDPSRGRVKIGAAEISAKFTGIALELSPAPSFEPQPQKPAISLRQFLGRIYGMKRALGRILLISMCIQIASVALPLFNQILVDEAIARHDLELTNVMLVGFVLLVFFQFLLGLLKGWMSISLDQELSLRLRGRTFEHLVRLPLAYFQTRTVGDISSKMAGLGAIQGAVTNGLVTAVLQGLTATTALVMMLLYSWKLTFIVVLSAICYGLLRWAFYAPLQQATSERIVLAAKEQTHFIETLRSVQSLKLFGREDQRRQAWQNLLVDIQNRDVATAKLLQWFAGARTLIFAIENLFVLWLSARSIIEHSEDSGAILTLGMLFAFIAYQRQFAESVGGLTDLVAELRMVRIQSDRLADIVHTKPEPSGLDSMASMSQSPHSGPLVELRGVGFRYGDGEPWLFRNVNIQISKGDNIALLGPSGAGKSTLLKIMLGLIQPSEGEVLIGGVSLSTYGLAAYRNLWGAAMQDDVLLAGTIIDNIAFFAEQVDMERVFRSAEVAGISMEIDRMPMRYHTLVGDLGAGLSGGQQQRIILARAIYRRPEMLALDEASSNIDVQAEGLILSELAGEVATRVVISHRPETVVTATRQLHLLHGVFREFSLPKHLVNAEVTA